MIFGGFKQPKSLNIKLCLDVCFLFVKYHIIHIETFLASLLKLHFQFACKKFVNKRKTKQGFWPNGLVGQMHCIYKKIHGQSLVISPIKKCAKIEQFNKLRSKIIYEIVLIRFLEHGFIDQNNLSLSGAVSRNTSFINSEPCWAKTGLFSLEKR